MIAAGRKVLECIHDGIPGARGESRELTVGVPPACYSGGGYQETIIYLAATWCTSEALGRRAYETGHVHRGVMAIIKRHG